MGGDMSMEKVFMYFQQQVQNGINDLNAALDNAQGGGKTGASQSGGAGGTGGTSGASGASGASSSGTTGGSSQDPIQQGSISYLFQMLSVAMQTEASTVSSMKSSLQSVAQSIR
jgi:hypothetical protein